jgi:hypothetical protein
LELRRTGIASKRGLIPRMPTPERLVTDIEEWLREEYGDTVRSIRPGATSGERVERHISLHPAAPALHLVAAEEAQVSVAAVTVPTGPGYHTFVARLIERLGESMAIEWEPYHGDGARGIDADAFASGDRPTAERAYLAWLGATLARARDARRIGAGGIHIGTPPGVVFAVDAAVATALGPRDDEWLERALGDTAVAIDITPWWADAMTARYLLDRALCLLWTDVRWRRAVGDSERAIDDEALRLLRRAFPLDPSLPYPWAAWLELVDLRNADEPMIAQIRERAARAAVAGAGDAPIGYRRQPVTIIHEGWTLEVPGSFGERRTDEEWWGGEGGRAITLAAVETAIDDRPMPARAFLDQVAGDLGGEVLNHTDGQVQGRARLSTDGSSGVGVGVLDGFSAVSGMGAAIRVEFDDAADWQWAIDMWRALRPAASA